MSKKFLIKKITLKNLLDCFLWSNDLSVSTMCFLAIAIFFSQLFLSLAVVATTWISELGYAKINEVSESLSGSAFNSDKNIGWKTIKCKYRIYSI